MKEKKAKRCFAYTQGRCKVLKSKKCDGCSFYKTMAQYKDGQKKAIDIILTMDEVTIRHISETYYEGKLKVRK